jgi:spore coat protein U-like protein
MKVPMTSPRLSRPAFGLSTILVLFLGWTGSALGAGSQSSTVIITASIPPSCTIGTAAIAFTAYDPINAHATVPDDRTGDIVIRCTKGANGITIGLGNGANNSGAQRRMVNTVDPTTTLDYEVYQDSGRITVWGPGDGGAVRSGADLNGTGFSMTVTMFGRIPPHQLSASAGTYNDTLVSTILF